MWPELARAWVGMAAGATQLQRMAGFTAVFSVLAAGAERMAPTSIADNDERQRFGARVTGLAHALSTIGLAFWILTDEEETKAMDADRMYGFSDRANLLFAHSCGFFLWDIYVCVARAKIDWGFLVHGISCFLCYLFGQYPYLHYWGVRFLLYELSTPFLNAMLLLRQLGHKGLLHSCMQNMFGYSFLLVRIFYGFTISALFTRDTLDLLRSGKAHSTFVVIYYLAANVALNSLNSFWLYKMLMTRSKKST
ncbi:Topoisomerase I damage affected protein 4 [Hondaea fermentalgiana]|uniref:Topoisomerase I damage affected protein 4 n=1 Tax=Hondaea fermentalgiana TaxID=2315210 RepID=A0A2R5GCQ9_9STRA|nr:Topoisomerase I damage affected protein 4 [Hondaea fermentalgiana]|eukprot:GBG25564.1 Topoisomerase I damage affected protein 4 [Hondaea fermentalgiana]